ncbi:DUF3052 domain-containing protein [Micrococcales bacterium 31B]|nr:DUF3052 domain-containing protein [Micrococcales bacterium 31B]
MDTDTVAQRLGLKQGMIIQEFGYDDDADLDLRDAIEDSIDADLVDEDFGDVVDGVVLWWRDVDGDLVDALVDAMVSLEEGGPVWVLTRKAGRDGYVPASDVTEAATLSGLHAMNSISLAPDWVGTRLASARQRHK